MKADRGHINHLLFALLGFERVKKKSSILLIILVHVFGWAIFLLVPLLFYPMRFAGDPVWKRELVTKIFPIVLFYVNYYYFLPRFFETRKYGAYFLVVAIAMVLIMTADVFIRREVVGAFGIQVRGPGMREGRRENLREPMPGNRVFFFNRDSVTGPMPPPEFREKTILGVPQPAILFAFNRTISTCILLLLAGGLIRLAHSFLRNQNEKKSLENANLNAEVNFLKSQINPHFLFNTLNSIYSQAHAKSDKTEYSILKLSELLRYVLYDSGENKVPLSKDIEYINNYIDLQRMRLSPKVELNYSVQGDVGNKTIAPLLLIGFIENAFKHGISYTNQSVVNIHIRIFEKTLTLMVSNPILEKDSFAPGGIGLKNVRRRLELLYPKQHQLDIYCRDGLYIVNLKLEHSIA